MVKDKKKKLRTCGTDRGALALWAADCAERALRHFNSLRPHDDRPRKAIESARAWARGWIGTAQARAAALAAHAAARAAGDPAARAAARAAGHAAATAHMAAHARYSADYAAAAAAWHGSLASAARERAWQLRRLPKRLRRGPLGRSSFPSSPLTGFSGSARITQGK